jgi:hypothetical protein
MAHFAQGDGCGSDGTALTSFANSFLSQEKSRQWQSEQAFQHGAPSQLDDGSVESAFAFERNQLDHEHLNTAGQWLDEYEHVNADGQFYDSLDQHLEEFEEAWSAGDGTVLDPVAASSAALLSEFERAEEIDFTISRAIEVALSGDIGEAELMIREGTAAGLQLIDVGDQVPAVRRLSLLFEQLSIGDAGVAVNLRGAMRSLGIADGALDEAALEDEWSRQEVAGHVAMESQWSAEQQRQRSVQWADQFDMESVYTETHDPELVRAHEWRSEFEMDQEYGRAVAEENARQWQQEFESAAKSEEALMREEEEQWFAQFIGVGQRTPLAQGWIDEFAAESGDPLVDEFLFELGGDALADDFLADEAELAAQWEQELLSSGGGVEQQMRANVQQMHANIEQSNPDPALLNSNFMRFVKQVGDGEFQLPANIG